MNYLINFVYHHKFINYSYSGIFKKVATEILLKEQGKVICIIRGIINS